MKSQEAAKAKGSDTEEDDVANDINNREPTQEEIESALKYKMTK